MAEVAYWRLRRYGMLFFLELEHPADIDLAHDYLRDRSSSLQLRQDL